MSVLSEYYAAMAAALIDAEIIWKVERLPEPRRRTPLEQAIWREAVRRELPGLDWYQHGQPRRDAAAR